ncbi:armadillo-type protein [Leucosporidium creatinivorum]|uniref:Armadillo-type protein n=1 Tax=Leucosporidium creatinivorum TaxID=106004 RepID=A0A1Y2DNY7_9BASI|nr:armadillo-type protein [Leucosporidium creatinivorum]
MASPDFTQSLRQALAATLSAEATTAKEATTQLRKEALADQQCIPALFEIGSDAGVEEEVRTLALTLLRKQVLSKGFKQWKAQPEEIRAALKARALEVAVAEPSDKLRISFSRLISSLAHSELPAFTWPALLPCIFTLSTSATAAHREVALPVIYYLLDTLVVTPPKPEDGMANNVPQLLELVERTVQDAESLSVKVWSVKVLGKLSEFIETKEGAESAKYQSLVPAIIAVLGQSLEAHDKESARQCFDVVEGLTLSELPVLNPHLGSILEFLLTSAANRSYETSLRIASLDSVLWIVKFKKGKVQSLNLAPAIVSALLPIGAESEPTSESEMSPGRSARTILEDLAVSFPPTQTLPALFEQLQALSTSADPALRKSGVAALGVVVEGCAAALHAHMKRLWPFLEAMLKDSDVSVRKAACSTLSSLCTSLGDDCSKQHAMLMPILSNLLADPETQPTACVALDSLLESLDQEDIEPYLPSLMDALLSLLGSIPLDSKGMVVGAIGSAAHAAKVAFAPYLATSMQHVEPFLGLTEDGDASELRVVAQDTVGTFAQAVGKEAFRPFYEPTMKIAVGALALEGLPAIRECSYSFFAILARVYGEDFAAYLPAVMPALLAVVQRDEDSAMLGSHTIDLASAVAPDEDDAEDGDFQDEDDSDFEDIDSDSDGSDLDEANEALFEASAALASQKEVAIDALTALFAEIKVPFLPYVESSGAALLANLKPHWHAGIRRASIVALLSMVATAHTIVGGPKWEKGAAATALNSDVATIANAVLPRSLPCGRKRTRSEEVVDELCGSLSDALLVVGPSLIVPAHLEDVCKRLEEVLSHRAPCQVDDGDEDEDNEEAVEQSESEAELLISAADLVGTLATVLGGQFAPFMSTFLPLMSQLASADRPDELRSSAIGSLAEVCLGLEAAVTPFTEPLFALLLQACTDAEADIDVKTNAAFALGTLIEASEQDLAGQYGTVLSALHPLFEAADEEAQGARDNAAGAVARMIVKNSAAVPLEQVLPVFLKALPLKRDFAESKPVMAALVALIRAENAFALQHLDQILALFRQALVSVAEGVYPEVEGAQVEEETKQEILKLLKDLNGSSAEKLAAAGLSSYVA